MCVCECVSGVGVVGVVCACVRVCARVFAWLRLWVGYILGGADSNAHSGAMVTFFFEILGQLVSKGPRKFVSRY